jgi:EAL domain-containing protein (putative c-di-GMP-specific phosphodiesterase class I)/GGDEF domain-containing protein
MTPATLDTKDMLNRTMLFACSFRHFAEIADIAVACGWDAVVTATASGIDPAYVESGAPVVLIDARGAIAQGLAAAQTIAPRVAEDGGALLFVLSRRDCTALDRVFELGATHFLIDPASDGELIQSLRFAARHVTRAPGRPGIVDRRDAMAGARFGRDPNLAQQWIAARIGDGQPVSVVLVSLSRLDIVNAAHGRPAVDSLIEVAVERAEAVAAEAMAGAARVARLGGADLALVVGAGAADIAALIAALDEALARPFAVANALAVLGCRFGVASHQPGDPSDPADGAATLMRRAFGALAKAKTSDGAMLQIASAAHDMSLDALAIDLHHAIELDEIDIRFQPQVEIASGRITGVEALARWDHRKLGPLGADALFAAADRADLGIALSDHIQRLVLARALAWPEALATLRVSLNLTAADIARPGFATLFLARVDDSGFPRGRLTVEITETGLIADLASASTLLTELRGAGCRVAIDDFGTGYSSLAYLKDLPLDYVKIDKALVHDIGGSPRDRVVVAGAITMARSLGLSVIAEGVETREQLELLAACGASLYQGFLLSEPVGDAALLELVTRA